MSKKLNFNLEIQSKDISSIPPPNSGKKEKTILASQDSFLLLLLCKN
jgi:hypothetical protein